MFQGSLRREAFVLFPCQSSLEEAFAFFGAPAGDLQRLALDIFLVLEWETACDHAKNDHAKSPDIHRQGVVHRIEFRTPIRLRTTFLLHTSSRWQVDYCAEIAQVDSALRMFNLAAILQVVVTFQISVDDILLMKPMDSLEHHLAHVLDTRDWDHALVFPVELHSFNHVATPVNFQDHAHENLFVVDVVELHDARVCQPVQHVYLLLDLSHRSFDLIDHLDCILFPGTLPLAGVNHSESSLTQHLAQGIFVQQFLAIPLRGLSAKPCCISTTTAAGPPGG
mmetsp:Transcript_90386/g.189046  ORF Transcript_90386/g.189046 Transcript_90386/m.189046 type:complete len:280 (+) Transcript_90386:1671-2510(+)